MNRRNANSFRPCFETLEDRSLLSGNSAQPVLGFVRPTPGSPVIVAENGHDWPKDFVYVSLKGPMRSKVSVDLVTQDVTTTSEKDYKVKNVKRTLTFTPGGTCLQRIKILVTNDGDVEQDEKFNVRLVNAKGGKIDGKANVQPIVIRDNDAPLKLWEASFAGEGRHTITADDSSEYYGTAQWLDNDHNGSADDSGDHRWPVSYGMDTKLAMQARFYRDTPDSWQDDPSRWPDTCNVRIKGPDGAILIDASEVQRTDSETMMLGYAEAKEALPAKVDCIDDYHLQWEFRYGDGPWLSAGASANQLYVTMGDPKTTLFHTLVDIGCRNGRGLGTNDQDRMIDAIWAEFSDRQVTRVERPTTLTYWKNGDARAMHTDGLLFDGTGQCGSWAEFFIDTLRAQGIVTAKKIMVYGPANSQAVDGHAWMLVKNYAFQGSGSVSTFGDYRYEVGVDVSRGSGVPGQNNLQPPAEFENHFIVAIGGRFYDPSYGGHPFASHAEWERASLDGSFINRPNALGQVHKYAKKIDANPAVVETVFISLMY